MLNVQRTRHQKKKREGPDVQFVRRLLLTHAVIGLAAITLLLFHELFSWALVAVVWYVLTLHSAFRLSMARKFARLVLGVLCWCFTLGGIFLVVRVHPALDPDTPRLLTPVLIPLWLGVFNLAYFVGGLTVLFHKDVGTATHKGFNLWW